MKQQYEKEIERLGWWFREYKDDDSIEIGQASPEGEDFFFTVGKKNIVREVREYADDFDADEHAEMWTKARGHVSGVPMSIRDLINDADAIKKMLADLADALERVDAKEVE